ncbi:hypothetical protein CMMCA002_08215 [Clavibacter michiganensis subsp. michiganensis]|nr:hypothetical protein CMMCA002_08215 [Clavibacter michiganensis subsp. michiganensis]
MGSTLIPNTSRQSSASTSTPPSTGPTSMAVPVHAVHEPMARACAGPRKACAMRASELGTSSAPAAPWAARAAMRITAVGAIAHTSDVTPKPTRPQRSTRTRPKASESEPARRISAPRVMR